MLCLLFIERIEVRKLFCYQIVSNPLLDQKVNKKMSEPLKIRQHRRSYGCLSVEFECDKMLHHGVL